MLVNRRSKSYDCITQHRADAEASAARVQPRLLPPGMLFGIDIGGTLAKIVFREPASVALGSSESEQIARLNKYFMSHELFPAEHLDKSTSMPSLPLPSAPSSSLTAAVSDEHEREGARTHERGASVPPIDTR